MFITKDRCCSSCGQQHMDTTYPKTCRACGFIAWSNPIPVVVCVVPVMHRNISAIAGLAVAKRAIEPSLGTWAFIGGHVENGETLEDAAAREWGEETGLEPRTGYWQIGASYANGKGHVLVSAYGDPITLAEWEGARLCPENSAFGLLRWYDQLEIGFPIHQAIAMQWFYEQGRMD